MIELIVCCVCSRMFLTSVPSRLVSAAMRGETARGSPPALTKTTLGPAVVRRSPEVGEIRDHERVARGGRELLDDSHDVEGDDVEAAGGAVEQPQLEQVAEAAASSR